MDAAALQRRLAQLHNAMGAAGNAPETEPASTQARPRNAAGVEVLASLSPSPADGYTRTQPRLLWRMASLPLAGVLLWWATQYATAPRPEAAPTGKRLTASPPMQMAMVVGPAPAVVHSIGQTSTAVPADATENLLRDRLEGWRLAWASRDVDAYLAHYSPRFVTANGQSRSDWAADRRRIIASRPDIVLHLSAIEWQTLGPDRWQVHFLQDYAAAGHVEKQLPKTLELVRQGGQWNIVSERAAAVRTTSP